MTVGASGLTCFVLSTSPSRHPGTRPWREPDQARVSGLLPAGVGSYCVKPSAQRSVRYQLVLDSGHSDRERSRSMSDAEHTAGAAAPSTTGLPLVQRIRLVVVAGLRARALAPGCL